MCKAKGENKDKFTNQLLSHFCPLCFSITNTLTEKGRLSGASQSEQMFEHIFFRSNNFRTFVMALGRVNIQDCRL